jgi:Flp pilus assembly pilin Flp
VLQSHVNLADPFLRAKSRTLIDLPAIALFDIDGAKPQAQNQQNTGHKLGSTRALRLLKGGNSMGTFLRELCAERHWAQRLWAEEQAQDIAEYAVMLAVILVLVVGTVQLVGSNANTAFSTVASTLGTQ